MFSIYIYRTIYIYMYIANPFINESIGPKYRDCTYRVHMNLVCSLDMGTSMYGEGRISGCPAYTYIYILLASYMRFFTIRTYNTQRLPRNITGLRMVIYKL